jgi:hypothetical protein
MADFVVAPSPSESRNAGGPACFVEPAPLIDVLFDQFEYLIWHTAQECPLECPDCARFEQIKKLLLVPFETVATTRGHARQ